MERETKEEIKRLNAEGLSDAEIAEKIGYCLSWTTIWRINLGLKRNTKPGGRPRNLYYVWREKDDEILAVGTARECSEKMGIKLSSFYSEVTRTRSGQHKYYKILVENLGGDECVGEA